MVFLIFLCSKASARTSTQHVSFGSYVCSPNTGMCLLPAAIRHSTADIGTRLEMKIEEFFQLREVSGVDASAVIAENELVGTLLTLDRLREAATCASMRTLPPTSIAEANRADAFWQQHLAPEQEETETAEAGEGSVRNRSTDPESLRIQTRDEIRSNYTLIGRLLGILKKVILCCAQV